MKFFSGFGFKREQALFKEYLDDAPFVLSGFSYGAQLATQEALNALNIGKRVEKLQLISPAYFNDLPRGVLMKELDNFVKNRDLYMNFFYKKAAYPYKGDITPFKSDPDLGQLKSLLLYRWKEEDLERLKSAGVDIEVFLGGFDKIVDAKKAGEFFAPFASVYTIKDAGHLLR